MFLLAAAAYAINYALEIVAPIATWGVLVSMLGAALGGAAAAILWVSQGGYMKRLLDRYEVPEQFRGRYYGIQNGLIYGNYLLAGLVTTLCLGDPGDVSFYFTVLAGIAMLALLFCCLCLDPLGDARITVDLENR